MKKIGKIADCRTGLVLKRYKGETPYPLLSARYIDELGLIRGTETFHGGSIPEEHLLREGDVVMKIASPNQAIYIPREQEGVVVSSFYFVVRVRDEAFNPRFLAVYFNTRPFRAAVEQALVCSTVKSLKISDLKELEVPSLSPQKQQEAVAVALAMQKEALLLRQLREKEARYYQSVLTSLMEEGESAERNGHKNE